MESWSKNINAVKSVDTSFTDEKAFKLAMLLENTKSALGHYERLYETTQPMDIGPFKKHGFDLITAVMPSLIAEDIVSTQPLSQKVGQIFFLKYIFGSNKGTVKRGDTMFDAFQVSPGYSTSNYSSEYVDTEVLGVSGKTTYEGNLDYTPLRPGTIKITAGSVEAMDDGEGKIVGTGVTGTIDYLSGAYALEFDSAADGDVEAEYYFDLETAPSTIPQVDVKIEEAIVTARPRKLRALYSFDAGYDLKMSQGVDIDEALLTATSHEIKNEIDGEIMLDLYRQAGLASTWNMTYEPSFGISQSQHRLAFIDEINSAANQIFQHTRRAVGNYIIVGKLAADIIESVGAPRYVPATTNNPVGPHFAGTLDGRIKVYKNPYYAEDEYLVGYKGETFLDAGYVYAPYLPIFSSQLIMLDDFIGRRGFATSYGKRMNNNKLYVKGKITRI